MSSPDVLLCSRGKHVLARIQHSAAGVRQVEIRQAVMTDAGIYGDKQIYTRADLQAAATFLVDAPCACGHIYQVDVAQALRTGTFAPATRPNASRPSDNHRARRNGVQ